MPFDPTHLHEHVAEVFGQKPHPQVPEIEVRDYEAFARASAKMFGIRQPDATHVQTTYHALTNANISPSEFERLWTIAKPLSTRLLDRNPTLHDLGQLQHQSPEAVQVYYMNHPHPQYSTATAGEIDHYATHALRPARVLAGREPNLVELHKFATGQYTMDDIVAHYSEGRRQR